MAKQGRLLHIVEKADSDVFWLDDHHRYVAFSPTHAETMRARFDADIALGQSILDHVEDEAARATLRSFLDQALAGRVIVEVRSAGEGTPDERHIEVRYTPVPDPGGAIAGVFVCGRDITAASRMETELWQRENLLTLSQQVGRAGHWFSTFGDDVVHLSGPAAEMIGVFPATAELLTTGDFRALLRRIVHPEDRDEGERLIAWPGGPEPLDFEFRVVLETGEIKHIHGRVQVVTQSDGRSGVLGVFQDDSEHWRAVQDLVASEARLRHAEEMAGMGHWSVDPATGATHWSRGFFDILGLDPAQVSPNSSLYLEMVHPDDRDAALRDAAAGIAGEDMDVLHRVVRPDGEVRLLRMRGETQRDETREAVLIFGTAQDVTEPARMRDDLIQSEHRFHQLFDLMAQGFGYVRVVFDPAGRPADWAIVMANPALERMVGAGPLTGRRAASLVPGMIEDHADLFERAARVARGGEPDELDFVTLGGRRLTIWLHPGEPDHFTALVSDVTEQRRAEDELAAANSRLRRALGEHDATPGDGAAPGPRPSV